MQRGERALKRLDGSRQGRRRVALAGLGGRYRVRMSARGACASFPASGRLPVGDHASVQQFDAAFRPSRDLRVVGDDDDGVAVRRQIGENAQHVLAVLRVERARRLVREDQSPAVHQRPGDRHALLLAAGKRTRPVPEAGAEAEGSEQPLRPVGALQTPEACVGRWQLDVLPRRRRADQVVGLEHEAERSPAQGGQLVRAQPTDVPAPEPVHPRGGPIQAAEDVHERRLAGPRGAHDGDELAAFDAQRHVRQRPGGDAPAPRTRAAVYAADASQFDQRRFGLCHPPILLVRGKTLSLQSDLDAWRR